MCKQYTRTSNNDIVSDKHVVQTMFFASFKGEILKVNDDLSRVLEYYRKIFGAVQPPTPGSAPTSVAQVEATTVTSPGTPSTLIDLGTANQTTVSEEVKPAVSSVLENELKALGTADKLLQGDL